VRRLDWRCFTRREVTRPHTDHLHRHDAPPRQTQTVAIKMYSMMDAAAAPFFWISFCFATEKTASRLGIS
jgi:hypothetical protein